MERTLSLNAVAKKYDEAFKRQAVEMVLLGGKTVKQAAEDLGVSQYSIYQWKKQFFPLGEVSGSIGKSSSSGGLPEERKARGPVIRRLVPGPGRIKEYQRLDGP